MGKFENLIAKDLLSIKAVFFRPEEPFTWASGIKSPVYCDNRLTLTAPAVRDDVENSIAEVVKEKYPDVDVLMGTSTAGIAHAAIVGHILGLPMGYVRSGHKDHGRQNQIEGKLEPGQKVVVIEDLISTGGSVIEVVDVLREAGAEVVNDMVVVIGEDPIMCDVYSTVGMVSTIEEIKYIESVKPLKFLLFSNDEITYQNADIQVYIR